MAVILGIETSGDLCSVALFDTNSGLLASIERNEKNIHASALTSLIQQCVTENDITLNQLDAIALSKGPGSYTGLRVGASTAKGLCYALQIPLIAVDTLKVMVRGFIEQNNKASVICPMIDARRMEVFTAVFSTEAEIITPVHAEILNEDSFIPWFDKPAAFIGNGALKMKTFSKNFINASFYPEFTAKASFLVTDALKKWEQKEFEDVALFEPFYLKEFFTTSKI
jgi:tRNA threonylcarbamoyladenosine biosynthesis protein TsaB